MYILHQEQKFTKLILREALMLKEQGILLLDLLQKHP